MGVSAGFYSAGKVTSRDPIRPILSKIDEMGMVGDVQVEQDEGGKMEVEKKGEEEKEEADN